MSALANIVNSIRTSFVRVLATARIKPNHLTILGAIVAIVAGYLASEGQLLAAGLIFLAGSLLDGLDGALARHTDSASSKGAFLDSVLDRVGEGALFVGLAIHFARADSEFGIAVTVVALAVSMLVSYARARALSLGLNPGGFIPAPRPVRVALLSSGLIIGQPIAAIVAVAVLAGISTVMRIIAPMLRADSE